MQKKALRHTGNAQKALRHTRNTKSIKTYGKYKKALRHTENALKHIKTYGNEEMQYHICAMTIGKAYREYNTTLPPGIFFTFGLP